MENRWQLKNLRTGALIHISKPLFKVGRSSKADLTSKRVAMSRQQATFSILVDGHLYLQDDKSCNGTFVNDAKITTKDAVLLKHGDIIGFGCARLDIMVTKKLGEDMLDLIYEVIDTIAGSEIKLESNAQQIKVEETSSLQENFSQENDYIVISDNEEDDNPFASSQIFELSQRVNKTKLSLTESYDPYTEIKTELQDLDACELANVVPVDLTDEFDHFDSTSALINLLESPQRGQNTTEDILNTLENTSDVLSNKEKIIETNNVLETANTEIEFCDNQTEAESSKKEKLKRNDSNISNATFRIPEVPASLIEDEQEVKKSTSRDRRSSIPKRKSSINDEEIKKKKMKHTVDKECDGNSATKIGLTNIEKKSLKAVTDKTAQDNQSPKEQKSCEKSDKLGKDRLSKDPIITTTKTPRMHKDVEKIERSGSTNKDLSAVLLKNIDPRRNRRETTISHNSKMVARTILPNEIQDATITSNTSPLLEQNQTLPHMSMVPYRNSNNTQQRAHTVSTKKSPGIVWQSNVVPRSNNVLVNQYVDNMDDYISTIVQWSFSWVKQLEICDSISPPVSKKPPLMVPDSFYKYESYVDVFEPLALLELWQFVFQTLHEERNPVQVRIVHQRRHGELLYLDCECYYSDQDLRGNLALRANDFIIFEVKCRDAKHNYQYTCFAFIKSNSRLNVNNNGSKTPNYRFTLVTKNLNFQISYDWILVKLISNIGNMLKQIRTIKYLQISPLCESILNPNAKWFQLPQFKQYHHEIQNKLNPGQKQIVCEASQVCLSSEPGVYLINGPPGTGKSTVIVNIILEVIFQSYKMGKSPHILLAAPSNAAVDNILLKLNETRRKFPDSMRHRIKIVRFGPNSSINPKADGFKFSCLVQNHIVKQNNITTMPEYKEYHEKNMIDQLIRKKLGVRYQYELKAVEDLILHNSNVICTTLNSCVNGRIVNSIKKGCLAKFTCCIIDEATQCNELESLLPIQIGLERFVLVGDPKQLPAVVCNKQAQLLGYGRSLFSRISENFKDRPNNPVRMLTTQYRMAPEICDYPNRTFYQGQLTSVPLWKFKLTPSVKPYLVFNLSYPLNNDTSDYVNTNEAHLICKILETLKERITTECYSIGIIAPYKAQKDLLKTKISSIKFSQKVDISVNTVDSFQGMENDIIIISCVRVSNNYFLQNELRLNVALTRAKQALYVVGNYSLFKECKPLYDLREDAKKRKLCFDISNNPKSIQSLHKLIFQ